MATRLQVLLDDAELRSIQRLARQERLSTAEWVRRRLREGIAAGTPSDTESKVAAIDAAYRLRAPTAQIAQMLDEIERGYRMDPANP